MPRTRKTNNDSTLVDHSSDLAEKLQSLERHLNQLEDQLIRAQRLAALGTMASMVAHEFNNILTPVVSYAQYALGRDDVDLMKKALEKAFTNGREAADVCQSLLAFGRGENTGTACLVDEVVAAAVKCLVRNLAKDNIELQIDVPPRLAVAVEGCLLQQVLYNLIINARDAMLGRPGRLKISAAQTEDGRVEVKVADSGAGIDPAVLPKIFDPFFTTKNNGKSERGGSGLGLAVTRHILEKHGAEIRVQSTPGQGTTFTLILPQPKT